MTDLKIDGKVTAKVAEGLAPYVEKMFARQDGRWLALVEFKHSRREEPGAGEDKAPAVKIRLTHCEIFSEDHESMGRELLQTMYKGRTAEGTLDDAAILEHQVIPDQLKWAVETMLWPPRPGDVWEAAGEPYFAYVGDDGDVVLMDDMGEVFTYNEVLAKTQELNLRARKKVERGDDGE